MSKRQTHSARSVGRMDAPADRRSSGVPQSRVGFTQSSEAAEEDWRTRAACRLDRLEARKIDVGVFFPLSYTSPEGIKEVGQAKSICVGECPVREQCLRFAFESGSSDGIYGGLDPDERRAVKRKASRGAAGSNRKYPEEMRTAALAAFAESLPVCGGVPERAAFAVGKRFKVDKKTVLRWLEAECGAEVAE